MVKFETPGLQHDHGQCLVSSDFIRQSLDIGQLPSSSTCLLTSICFCSCMPALQTKCTAPGRHQAPGDDLNMFHVNALQKRISDDFRRFCRGTWVWRCMEEMWLPQWANLAGYSTNFVQGSHENQSKLFRSCTANNYCTKSSTLLLDISWKEAIRPSLDKNTCLELGL